MQPSYTPIPIAFNNSDDNNHHVEFDASRRSWTISQKSGIPMWQKLVGVKHGHPFPHDSLEENMGFPVCCCPLPPAPFFLP